MLRLAKKELEKMDKDRAQKIYDHIRAAQKIAIQTAIRDEHRQSGRQAEASGLPPENWTNSRRVFRRWTNDSNFQYFHEEKESPITDKRIYLHCIEAYDGKN
jgi:hypothetical protein